MTDWNRLRDHLYQRLHEHVGDCLLCDRAHPGVRVHGGCEDGIVLLTEWHIAKCNAERRRQHGASPVMPS